VLNAVNETFAAILSADAGELEYDERAKLVCGAEQPTGGAELHLVKKEREDAGDGEDALADAEDALADAADLEVEGRLIAERIRSLMDGAPYTDARTGETADIVTRILRCCCARERMRRCLRRRFRSAGFPAMHNRAAATSTRWRCRFSATCCA
jgi:ATP-dependent helicase/nuclease subunit A